jgi:endonuclease III
MGRNTNRKTTKTGTKSGRATPAATSTPAAQRKFQGAGKVKAARRRAGKSRPWTNAEIEEAFRRLHAANPEPRGELEYINPYTLLIAVVLSAQATDAGVNKATPALFALADTPEKMVALGEDKVRELIKTIGLYRTKAKNVIALSKLLIAEHHAMVPPRREALEALPGVGRKTANVVLNIAFGAETIAVDTHIFRVGNRTGIAPGKDPLEVEMKLEERVPKQYRRHAHHWLILHGRYTCKAQRPLCDKCLINDLCGWPEKATFMDPRMTLNPGAN